MNAINKREARPVFTKRPSGWWGWHLADSLGCKLDHPTITCSGMERSKNAADISARKSAREFNAQVTFDTRPVALTERLPSCERKAWRV